ncbi:MAG: hypothetical protein P1R58_06300 [bacterium]|nr:hypothetical protein [bacterium]
MRQIVATVFCFFSLLGSSVLSQVWDIENDSTPQVERLIKHTAAIVPPAEWQHWTPDDMMFQLYVNTDSRQVDDTVPRIDIMTEKGSWPFSMQYLGDTVYLFVVPPGFELTERSALDSLPDEFPFVIWAGTERAVYWFSYDAGELEIDQLQPALFISPMPVKPLPPDIVHLQLPGSGNHAKTIKQTVNKLKSVAQLIQLDEGFYETIWYHVTKTTIRTWKLNEVAFGTKDVAALLVFRLNEPGCREQAEHILNEFR